MRNSSHRGLSWLSVLLVGGCGAPPKPLVIAPVPVPSAPPVAAPAPETAPAHSSSAVPSPTTPCDEMNCHGATNDALEQALVQRAQQSKRKCYYPALSKVPTLEGRATIQVMIASTGEVCSAAVTSNQMAEPDVAECTAFSYRGAPVPAPNGGSCVHVTIPIRFAR